MQRIRGMDDAPHKKLLVWHKAKQLARRIYHVSEQFPKDERFALTSQVRRASVSIFSNISEGAGRWTGKDKLHFYTMARGSLTELESQMDLTMSMGFHSDKKIADEIAEVGRMLNGLISSRRMKEGF